MISCKLYYILSLHVGPSHGRKMTMGYLATQGTQGTNTILSLEQTILHTNPIPYRVEYFGEKVHIDQNDKLTMFRHTRVCAIDSVAQLLTLSQCQRRIVSYFMSTYTGEYG